jgi:hypothetical protein
MSLFSLKGWLLVKKLLALLLTFGLISAMSFGLVGCGDGGKKTTTTGSPSTKSGTP